MCEEAGNPELATLMLCLKKLARPWAGYLDAVCKKADNERPELDTLMLCMNRLAMRDHTARIPSHLPLRVATTGRNHLNEEFTPLLPTGIGEKF